MKEFERKFKDMLIRHFEKTTKTGWGKKEIVKELTALWIFYLERFIEDED